MLPPPDISLLSGNLSLNSYTKKSKKILWVSAPDFYTLKEVKEEEKMKEKFILFVDDCLASTDDWNKVVTMSRPIDEEKYFRLLNRTFDKIERDLNLKIIIAAHPQGKYIDNYDRKFNGRKVIFDKTASLTSFSELVISHFSTSIGYAIMCNKPILLLTSNEISRHRYGMKIAYLSHKIRANLINIEEINKHNVFKIEDFNVDEEKYDNYFKDLIRNNNCNENKIWEELINFIRKND